MGVQVEGCSMPREWGMSPLSSPRGVELHKPTVISKHFKYPASFRPLAGLSCINLSLWMLLTVGELRAFPAPRGVELHKPLA